jgi:hypothetical protein
MQFAFYVPNAATAKRNNLIMICISQDVSITPALLSAVEWAEKSHPATELSPREESSLKGAVNELSKGRITRNK